MPSRSMADVKEGIDLPALDIEKLVLDPGDDIIFSIRSRTVSTGFNWLTAAFFDNVTITVAPWPAAAGLPPSDGRCFGTAEIPGRHG